MIRYIKGTVENFTGQFVILENNGIGYRIFSSANTIQNLKTKDELILYIHQHVREDQLSLYGFSTVEELEMFELLIGISKIGPKVGLSILSSMKPKDVRNAVLSNDKKSFGKVSGIGPKTAERMILELKDKVKDFDLWEYEEVIEGENASLIQKDAIDALIALGYGGTEAEIACSKVEADSVEELIKKALKHLL